MNIAKVKPKQDNVLLMFKHTAEATEDKLVNGLYIPRTALAPDAGSAIEATVIAAGPGYYADRWLGQELGTAIPGSPTFIPLDAAIKPGARVLCNAQALAADKVYDDGRSEYRIVRASCIEAVITEDRYGNLS